MMRRRTLAAAGLLTMTLGASAVGAQQEVVVSPTGPVRTLGSALELAPAGARIVVGAGVYREPTLIVTRPVTIVGQPGAVLDGEDKRQIIVVRADDVTIRGLELRNVGTSHVEDRAAIKVENARNCVIEDNRIEDTFFGIYLARVERCRVTGNRLHARKGKESASGNGIHLWTSAHITVERNEIVGHRDGIYLEFTHESDVRNNVSTGNLRYGLHFMYSNDCRYVANTFSRNGAGVAVMYTKRVAMTDNRFEDNWGSASYGLLLKEILEPELRGNVFSRNSTGLLLDGVTRLRAERNRFSENGWAVKLLASAQDGRFMHNEFVGNSFDVATNSRETTTTFASNYWDDYEGYDLDRDGIGDIPHRPVRLFSLLVADNEPLLITLRSPFAKLLDIAERVLPSITPETLADASPSMRRTP